MALEEEIVTGEEMPDDEFGRLVREVTERVLENMRTAFRAKVHVPAAAGEFGGICESHRFEAAVDEIRAFRAEELYAGGRRPFFRTTDGAFADPEEADKYAYHIVCRDERGALVGCLRLGLVDLMPCSAVEAHLGPERTAKAVRELGVDRTRILEEGRLVVAADQRRRGVAAVMLLVAHALANRLDRPIIWGTSGERDGQNSYFVRFGSSVLPGSSEYVSKYDDEVCVVVHDQRANAPQIRAATVMVDRAVFGAEARI